VRLAVAITLKIPDNTAYTALVTLRRLGVAVERVERSEVYFFEEEHDRVALAERVAADETMFNPNKHRLTVLDSDVPGSGEVWIEPLVASKTGPAAIAWRLLDERGHPVAHSVAAAAIERLLCNPAIDRALTGDGEPGERDIAFASE
jgi:phosphoribosylformylglycinamidine (FGAM) synthase PurS component